MRRPPFRIPVSVVLPLALVGSACTSAPPVQEMSDARQAIASAAGAEAGIYAPDLLADAERLLETAETYLQGEAYGRARSSAVRAKDRAIRALEQANSAAADDSPR
jgi:hypothetical protein